MEKVRKIENWNDYVRKELTLENGTEKSRLYTKREKNSMWTKTKQKSKKAQKQEELI